MRPAAVDRMTPSMPDFSEEAIRIEQFPARRSGSALLIFLVLAALLLLSPFFLIVSTAFAEHGLRETVSSKPLATAQVLTGLAFWLVLLGFPIYRLIDGLTRSRLVEIANGVVTVTDRTFGRETRWQAPITSFSGVAHYLRTSLSSVRHELILVHPRRERSVLLGMANTLHSSDLERVCKALNLPEISASTYRARATGQKSETAARPGHAIV